MNNEFENNNIIIDLDNYYYLITLKQLFCIDINNIETNNIDINNNVILSKNNLFKQYFVLNEEINFNNIYKKLINEYLGNNLENNLENKFEIDVNLFCSILINDLSKLLCNEDDIYFIFSKLIKYIFSNDQNKSTETNPKIDEITYENLYQLSNIIIYFISQKLINPIIGSILIAEVWPLVSYDQRLNKFIGREIEIFELQNKISNLKYINDIIEIEKFENQISNVKKKIIIEADIFVKINLT